MNFVKICWKLNDGSVASTLIQDNKQELVLEKLGKMTSCWVENN